MAHVSFGTDVVKAASTWKERCLIGDGSVLSTKPLWTPEPIAELVQFFVENLDWAEGDFFQRLEGQLAPASPEAKQLAAEMFWFMYLFVHESSIKPGTKRLQIKRIWEWSGEPLPEVSFELGAAMEGGIGNPGKAYNTHRWREFRFFILLMQAWKKLGRSDRQRLASDAWEFGAWIDRQETSRKRQLRHILLYLLFPDTYERIATGKDKRQVLKVMADRAEVDGTAVADLPRLEIDRGLLRLRRALEAEVPGQEVDFYNPEVKNVWKKKKVKETPATPDPPALGGEDESWVRGRFGDSQVWLIGAGADGAAWDDFHSNNLIGIGWDFLGDLADFESKDDITDAIRQHTGSSHRPQVSGLACWQFSREMKPGDIVIAKQGRNTLLGYGHVSSEYQFDDSRSAFQHIREVQWKRLGPWKLSDDHRITPKTLTEFTQYVSWLRYALELIEGKVPTPDHGPTFYGPEHGAAELFMSRGTLDNIIGVLRRKKNIVLEGPPGVGKTFAARRLAWILTGARDSSRVEMVQFHQSYAYEDFVQGWRPTESRSFSLQDGVFHRFCRRAMLEPDKPFVFIVDEINRANLSKVLGEMMMLIELDKRGPAHAMHLTYAQGEGERFYVPENVYLIGAMNTADRSLALVDYALRRRFSFVKLVPAFATEQFQNFLIDAGATEDVVGKIVERLSTLNRTIRDDMKNLGSGFEIGHSYFCPGEEDEDLDPAWFERIVKFEIEPLLHEYWFDEPERAQSAVQALLA